MNASSQSALKNGLYTAEPYIRDEEENAVYIEILADLFRELTPEGRLENELLDEIMSATWRLRRVRLVEADPAGPDIDIEATQNSLDRARSHAQNSLRRSLAELRKLQTERTIRQELDLQELPGIADSRQVLAALKARNAHTPLSTDEQFGAEADAFIAQHAHLERLRREQIPAPTPADSFCKTAEPAPNTNDATPAAAPAPVSIPASTPRNAPCPCKSGQKYKRCCARGGAKWSALSAITAGNGKTPPADAPPVLGKAA